MNQPNASTPLDAAAIASLRARRTAYEEGRAKWSDRDLLPYMGKWNAFSSDGTQILASAEDLADVFRLLSERGIEPQDTFLEPLRFADDSDMVGAGVEMEYHHSQSGEKLS